MKLVISKFEFGVLVFILIQLGSCVHSKRSDEAYVTLLYGDEFLLGVRVLGKSIRETGSTKDMVVLVSEGVSDYSMKLLKADGWIVEVISLLANPNQKRPKRFWGVYTKLKIFNMTNYKKVVYLDADTIVVKSIEDLFKCRKFCANLKHSERMNSGVMVVEPSEAIFKDMMSKVNTLHSYTGGDQGFLNSYFAGFANAHIFESNSDINSRTTAEMQRLSTLYNADVGLYVLANKWMVDEKELRVIHYTLGPFKPWDWWTSWLLKPVDVWQDIRVRLDETLPGTGGGGNPREQFLVRFLFLLPFCVLLFFCYRSFLQTRHDFLGSLCRNSLCDCIKRIYYKCRYGCRSGGLNYSSAMVSSSLPCSTQQFSSGAGMKLACLGAFSVLVCFTFVTISVAIAFLVVPRQVMPWTGLLLLYEWTFTLFGILFGSYLHLIHQWGRGTLSQTATILSRSESSEYDSMKGHQQQASACDIMALFCWFGMAFLSIAAPLFPCALGITAMFARLCMFVAGGLVLASFMTYASGYLAIRTFIKGLERF